MLRIAAGITLTVLAEAPPDFSWTQDRWLVTGKEVALEAAKQSAQATREIIHRTDGVIHREQHALGMLTQREDLNAEGKPIRELTYRGGKLAQRQYTDRDGALVSRELFDADGFISESISYEHRSSRATGLKETDHWWFHHGMPVKQVKQGREFTRQGDQWIGAKKAK